MSVERTLLFAAIFMFIITASLIIPAIAEDKNDDNTQIIVDNENDTVRIIIDGKEMVLIDRYGLHASVMPEFWPPETTTNIQEQ